MNRTTLANGAAAILLAAGSAICTRAQSIEDRLRALEAKNETLRQQLAGQQSTIDDLKRRLGETPSISTGSAPSKKTGADFGPVHISGEGGVGYFHTGNDGQYPTGSFRFDEAKLFLESPVWKDTYVYGELDLVTREANDEFFHLGEFYIDFENILRHWTDKSWLNLRVGRVYIPFGEEYNSRYVIDNPLISHSLSDIWGVDEGVEIYGSGYGFDYALAVQNGGHPTLHDFTDDKSFAGRIGYNFDQRARVSFSGMRTGKISAVNDMFSETWFGGGFFRAIGQPASTATFDAQLFELDAQTFWKSGHLKLAGGYFQYDDDDSSADNSRDGYYYYVEGVQNLTKKIYSAARFSQIHSGEGMPILGHGNWGKYYFGALTHDVWRLSIGLGYKFSDNLVGKIEYTIEQGELQGGMDRGHNNFLGAELGFKF
jgi:hypothetical protein